MPPCGRYRHRLRAAGDTGGPQGRSGRQGHRYLRSGVTPGPQQCPRPQRCRRRRCPAGAPVLRPGGAVRRDNCQPPAGDHSARLPCRPVATAETGDRRRGHWGQCHSTRLSGHRPSPHAPHHAALRHRQHRHRLPRHAAPDRGRIFGVPRLAGQHCYKVLRAGQYRILP